MPSDLPTHLHNLRRAAKLTQAQLGAALGMLQSTVSAVELGQRKIEIGEFAAWMTACGATEDERAEGLALAESRSTPTPADP